MSLRRSTYIINGVERYVLFDPEADTLAEVLRRMGFRSVKIGCGTGVCGSCTIILNGEVTRSCNRKMASVPEWSEITTIEGIGTPQNLHPLQVAWMTYGAAQCGFCTVGFIISAYGLLLKNNNPTRDEVRQWFTTHRNICRCTGYKPIIDAVMAAAAVMRGEKTLDDITYKQEGDSVYNTKLPRPTALAKVCGLFDYGDDVAMEMPAETLHCAVVQPRQTSHGLIKKIDYSEAEKMPGVVAVLTAKDVKGTNSITDVFRHPNNNYDPMNQKLLVSEKITSYGDVVALVVADTDKHAREAAAKVVVEIEMLPTYINALEATAPGAISIHGNNKPNTHGYQALFKGEKDVKAVISESPYSVTAGFYSQREPHLSIEGCVSQSYYDEDGMLTIQSKSQGITFGRIFLAAALGIPLQNFRILTNPTGGSFGWSLMPVTWGLPAIATMALQKPVSLSLSYEEFMHLSGKREAAFFNGTLACDKDGKFTALEYDGAYDIGAHTAIAVSLMDRGVRFFGFPYNIPEAKGLIRSITSNHGFAAAYRSHGSPACYTAMESLVDMLAEKVGLDPWEIRFKNVARPGDLSMNSYPYRSYPMEELLLKAKPIYYAAVEKAKAESTPEKRRGVGISCGGYNVSSSGIDKAGVKIEMLPNGKFGVYNTWQDMGQGGDIGNVVHICEALKPLGVKPEDIQLRYNDSKTCPDSGYSGGSRSHYMNGNAIINCANNMMAELKKEDGTFATYEELVAAGRPTVFNGFYDTSVRGVVPLDQLTGHGDESPDYTYAVFVSEVEVDTKTGKTKVLSMTCVCDVGVIGNILSVDGQAYGGMSHGIGFALSEDYLDFKRHRNMATCGIPTANDIPDGDNFNVIYVENPREGGPQGSSGCSEAFQSSPHCAVINAIYNATGVRVYELPALPAKVKAGLDKLAQGEALLPNEPYSFNDDTEALLDDVKEKIAAREAAKAEK